MNRKNLTAAVLAGLAGAAGIAGTAQAVNLNPDGLGQVLLYPYYTTNGGNQTVLSVVNTTDNAKAVKVRFLEGFNSREVLDFNLYMSEYDVWTAALADGGDLGYEDQAGVPHMITFDMSCTVPYFYDEDTGFGLQAFLDLAYNDNPPFFENDGGPTSIARAAEGHFEMIEMGTIEPGSDTEKDITHQLTPAVKDKDGEVTRPATWEPYDCGQLVKNWTRDADYDPLGDWTKDATMDIDRNSGGLFGGAAIINPDNGTMFSYNAAAVQGFDKRPNGIHYEPGDLNPSLNDGDQKKAYVFFGVPQNRSVELYYPRGVDAVSAVFMHEHIMNEYTIEEGLNAATEWVITFPTKNFYVDEWLLLQYGDLDDLTRWVPDGSIPTSYCNNWMPGDENPVDDYNPGGVCFGLNPNTQPYCNNGLPTTDSDFLEGGVPGGWEECIFSDLPYAANAEAIEPFTTLFQAAEAGKACEYAEIQLWDREERTYDPDEPTGSRPPVVSPSIPGECDPAIQVCDTTPFELCYEVNVLRFGENEIFSTPNLGTEEAPASLLLEIEGEFDNGWARIDLYAGKAADGKYPDHEDYAGLVGLPTSGFAAQEFENNFLEGGSVKAYYGGLFDHRGNVRKIRPTHYYYPVD
jgi:hypothetical protein